MLLQAIQTRHRTKIVHCWVQGLPEIRVKFHSNCSTATKELRMCERTHFRSLTDDFSLSLKRLLVSSVSISAWTTSQTREIHDWHGCLLPTVQIRATKTSTQEIWNAHELLPGHSDCTRTHLWYRTSGMLAFISITLLLRPNVQSLRFTIRSDHNALKLILNVVHALGWPVQ